MKPTRFLPAFACFFYLLLTSAAVANTNRVLSLESEADYLIVPDSDSLSLTHNFTLEAWVNASFADVNIDHTIIAKRRPDGGTAYALSVGGGRARLGLNDGAGNNLAVRSGQELSRSNWYHIAGTYDGAVAKVFVNGIQKSSVNTSMRLQNSSFPVTIGREDIAGEPRSFIGKLDEIRVWNRALTQEEIQARINLTLNGNEPGLVACWNFDDGTARDISPARNNGTFVGNATTTTQSAVPAPSGIVGWWPGDGNARDLVATNHGILVNATTRPGYIADAFAFTGSNSYVQIPSSAVTAALTNAITLEAWVWHETSEPNVQRYMTLTPDRAHTRYDHGRPVFELHFSDGALVPITANLPLEPRQWIHVVGTYDGKDQHLYVNGVRVSSASVNRSFAYHVPGDIFLGFPGASLQGLIDEAAIYDRALTTEEVQSHFAASRAGMSKKLTFARIGVFFPGIARLTLHAVPRRSVTIEASTDLSNWTTLGTETPEGGEFQALDPSAGTFTRRFYRAVAR